VGVVGGMIGRGVSRFHCCFAWYREWGAERSDESHFFVNWGYPWLRATRL
jgi:hypothetical protein